MDYLALFLASFLIWFMFALLFASWFPRRRLKGYQILHILAIVVGAFILTIIIKELFPSPRPFVVDGTNPLTFTVPQDSAFPSAHTSVAFALVFGSLYYSRRLGALFLPPAMLVGYGRVMTNVHFPIDIIGGIFVALIVAILLGHRRLQRFFQRAWITS